MNELKFFISSIQDACFTLKIFYKEDKISDSKVRLYKNDAAGLD